MDWVTKFAKAGKQFDIAASFHYLSCDALLFWFSNSPELRTKEKWLDLGFLYRQN